MSNIKLLWITGASSGIGKALALEAAKLGITVAATARRKEALSAIAQEAVDLGYSGKIHAFPADVTDEAQMMNVVAQIEQELGAIDHAILNAGVYEQTRAQPIEPSVYKRIFDVNVLGVVNCLAGIAPKVIERKTGCIYVVSSIAGYGGLPRAAGYGASKAALHNLIEGLWFDFKNAGVHIGVINPGFIRTPMTGENNFEMPFIMDAHVFASRVLAAIETRPYEIQFPRRLGFILKALNLLPRPLYLQLVYFATQWKKMGWKA